jgi:hypothetical protein
MSDLKDEKNKDFSSLFDPKFFQEDLIKDLVKYKEARENLISFSELNKVIKKYINNDGNNL